ncbi:unnamed protein product [Triticum turgidum subsp. durum]|uniref:Uncharacterized protein n=1 Tax=Triticum turgidum subsp. durum TaxID=4567 RepID=A0A9R0TN95_TRITD|nr:unnamed protein product [Triticum turgidum subsp. durum]
MDRLLLSRPPMPTPVHGAATAADGDLLELDVLWPASSAPGLLAALPDDEAKKKQKRAGGPAVRSAARAVPEKAALTPSSAARSAPVRIPSDAAARRGRRGARQRTAPCWREPGGRSRAATSAAYATPSCAAPASSTERRRRVASSLSR